MKKFLSGILTVFIAFVCAVGISACGHDGGKIKIVVPDGAPALAVAYLMAGNGSLGKEAEYKVVNASVVHTFVTGENPSADIAVLPVNAASKLLGSGNKYRMLGTVTHGNLFILKKSVSLGNIDSSEDLRSLIGKTVGVINLNNIPGLVFKALLDSNDIEYAEAGNGGAADKVNLKGFSDGTAVTPAEKDCDYFVVPEPVASTKAGATSLEFAGSVQSLYGANGYPQAVAVAKTEFIRDNPDLIKLFIGALENGAEWLLNNDVSGENIYSAIAEHYDAEPSFKAAQLTKSVIKNCAVGFVGSAECKSEVKEFIRRLIEIDPSSASVVSDGFFYINE